MLFLVMATSNLRPWESLEQWSATAFLVGGVLLGGVAGFKGLEAFAGTTVGRHALVDVGYEGLAMLVPVFGLLGLYPRLRDSAPQLSVAGVLAAVVSAGGIIALEVWLFGTTLEMGRFPAIPADAPVWTALALVVVFLTLALSFLLFGVTSLWTTALSRPVSLLLVIPAVMWFGLLGNVFVRAIANLDFFVYVVNGVSLLAIGYLLRIEGMPTDREEPAPDTIAR